MALTNRLHGQIKPSPYLSAYQFMVNRILTKKTYIQYVAEVKPTGKFVYSENQWNVTHKALIKGD